LEIALLFLYPQTMSTRSGGPRTAKGKAVTRYNAATHGIYSVTPVLPRIERQADWLAHRAGVFADLQPDGYMQEIYAERIALNSWRLRRLVRYEREQVRKRQRSIPTDLAIYAMYDGRKLEKEPLDEDLDRIDQWTMDALIPEEKELMLLMRYEGRLSRQLRLDMLHLEHMQRQRRESRPALSGWLGQGEETKGPAMRGWVEPADAKEAPLLSGRWGSGDDTNGPVLSLAPPESDSPALRPADGPESQPARTFAQRDPNGPALVPAEPESLGDPIALRNAN
jgi:hypothetical protein